MSINLGTVKESFENLMEFSEDYCHYLRQVAYILGTVEHETGATFLPVREGLKATDKWRRANLRYYPFYGRGFVQITWKRNYDLFEQLVAKHLGIKVDNTSLDWVMDNKISAFICVYGCMFGSFTGVAIPNYITAVKTDYLNARKVVNGMDKASHIMRLAQKWERKLRDGEVKEFNKGKFKY